MNTELKSRLADAVHWLTSIATVNDNKPVGVHGAKMPIHSWDGAIRGEYRCSSKQWNCLCPVWHTGQAVKALVMASEVLENAQWLKAAKYSADFIMRNRIADGKDKGLILAFEDHPDKVNTSAILESLDGLLHLSKATGDVSYQEAVLDALIWVRDNAWVQGKGHFNDIYNRSDRRFVLKTKGAQGRPLLDDALFIKGWQLTGDKSFKQIALDTAETLLKDEHPSGNWIKYIPCNTEKGNIHPRQTFWWGMSMLEVYKASNDERFLECFFRSVEWYKKALRQDGGFIRGTYADFNTDSFGHATSGTACAVIEFIKYYQHTRDIGIVEYIEKGLKYCMRMQFTNPDDLNLKGAILEKVLYPDGTDHTPYQIRDLGTIFFVQAASLYIDVFQA